MGLITERQLTNYLTSYRLQLSDPINRAVIKEFKKVNGTDSAKYLAKGFTRHQYILVEDQGKYKIAESKHLLQEFINASNNK